jgi:hypothetical protein
LIGAGPAGWLRESGSRLPHSKVTVPVTEGGLVGRGPTWRSAGPGRVGGRVGRLAGRRTPCAERAVILTAVQSLRLLVRRGLLTGLRYGTRGGKKADLCGVWTSWRKRSQARCPCHFWGRGQEGRPLWGACHFWRGRKKTDLCGEGVRGLGGGFRRFLLRRWSVRRGLGR